MRYRALLPVLVLSSCAFAGVDEDLAQAAKSPYDIARFVDTHPTFDWAPLWKALGINENLVQLQSCGEGQECSEELITILPFQVIVLLRGGNSHWEEVYLRFRRPGGPELPGPWSFAGCYSNVLRQYEPKHELIRFGSKPFLLISGTQQDAGVGWRGVEQAWFDLTTAKLEPVFDLLIEGANSGQPDRIGLHSRATIVSLESKPVERIKVTYYVDFVYPFPTVDNDLGSRSAGAVYTRRGGRFVFDAALSKTSEVEINKLYNFYPEQGPSNEDFLRYLLPQLKKVASGANADRKAWLKGFLANCKDTPEKREVQDLLARSPKLQ